MNSFSDDRCWLDDCIIFCLCDYDSFNMTLTHKLSFFFQMNARLGRADSHCLWFVGGWGWIKFEKLQEKCVKLKTIIEIVKNVLLSIKCMFAGSFSSFLHRRAFFAGNDPSCLYLLKCPTEPNQPSVRMSGMKSVYHDGQLSPTRSFVRSFGQSTNRRPAPAHKPIENRQTTNNLLRDT